MEAFTCHLSLITRMSNSNPFLIPLTVWPIGKKDFLISHGQSTLQNIFSPRLMRNLMPFCIAVRIQDPILRLISRLVPCLLRNWRIFPMRNLVFFLCIWRKSIEDDTLIYWYIVFEITILLICLRIWLHRSKSLSVARYACVFRPAHSNPHPTWSVQLFTKRCTS